MNEQEIALGALLAAHHACFQAYKRLCEESGYAMNGSRYKTFTGVSSGEIKEAYELIGQASRVLQKAVDRMRRYEDQQEGA